jgi:putative oxidoreductase
LETKALTETGSDTMDTTSPEMMAGGLLIVRLVIGTLMMGHATQKLFGWLGGYGLRGTGGFFEQLGFRPGVVFAAAASLGELISGLLVALGLFGPVGPALMISVMLVAMLTVHWSNGLFAATNGIEVPLLYAAVALGFALAGFGPYSLDALLGIGSAWSPGLTLAVLAAGVAGAVVNLGLRRHPAAAPGQA